jgi:hypothetical protein
MQLTKLRAAPVLQAEVPPCAPAGEMDGGTASQLIRSVRRTRGGRMRAATYPAMRHCLTNAGWLSAILCCTSCGGAPEPKVHTLPSGRELNVFYAGPIERGWHVVYHTQLPLSRELMLAHDNLSRSPIPEALRSEHQAVQCEVATLAADVESEAAASGSASVSITPTSTRREFIGWSGWYPMFSLSRGMEFTLVRTDTGYWTRGTGWTADRCGP